MEFVLFAIVGVAGVFFFLIFLVKAQNWFKDVSGLWVDDVETKDTFASYSGFLKKIDKKQYSRYIIAKNTTEIYIKDIVKNFFNTFTEDVSEEYNIKISQSNKWTVLNVGENLDFFRYHNLLDWLNGSDNKEAKPDFVIGFAANKFNKQLDYFFFMDKESDGNTEVGVFRSGASFFIYLPEAYEEYGNLMLTKDITLSFDKIQQKIYERGIDIEEISLVSSVSR